MLRECKTAMGFTGSLADGEIARLCEAGAMDLETRGVILPGTVEFVYTLQPVVDPDTATTETDPDTGDPLYREVVTDNSNLTDPFVMRAIITYAMAHFGNPPNYQNLISSYETQLAQLMVTSGYTDYSMVRNVWPPEATTEAATEADTDESGDDDVATE